jgi:CRISPR/Cas system CSM-associated protein Csm5 (group 7 of RAMP superfamily)
VIGEKVFKENDGKYTYYIAIEMSKEPVVNNVADRISKDAKLQLDFDKHQFQKIFNEEMEKFEAQQQ